jgi:uncharacterized YccA/Bax inhibitor family protein
MRSGNPLLRTTTYNDVSASARPMTLSGVIGRSVFLLLLVAATAAVTWNQGAGNPGLIYPMTFAGAIGGLIFGLVTSFKKEWASVTAPFYAILEGLFIGGVSLIMERQYHGLVLQAVYLTFGVAFALLGAYQSRIIRPSETFKSVIFAATAAIALVYVFSFVIGLLFHTPIAFLHDSGPLGIGFSLVVTAVAALNLVLDFDMIESGIAGRAPKWMEWYSAFALTVTLVWLYVEILRLLSKFRRN